MRKYALLIVALIIFGFLAFYKIKSVPVSLTNDEVSEVYNSYSLLTTGKDRYGLTAPLAFRSFGTYLAPLYTYLTIFPVKLFGLTDFSARFVSLIAGVAVVFLTYFITKRNLYILIVAISPWLLFFTRSSSEVTLSLAIFLAGFLFAKKSLQNIKYFIPACLFFGLSTYAYYSEKLVTPLFLVAFVYFFRKQLLVNKKMVVTGLVAFALMLVPNLLIGTSALTRRLDQTLDPDLYRILARFMSYFSPRNLFSDPDPQLVRSMPNLSVFYNWMIVPFVFGLGFVRQLKKSSFWKMIALLLVVSVVPASLTREPFYTIRVLIFLWSMSLVIGYGLEKIAGLVKPKIVLYALSAFVLLWSLGRFYVSYFVLFKYEREAGFGYSFKELSQIIAKNPTEKYIIDNSRDPSVCLRVAYYKKFDPAKFQAEVGQKVLPTYFQNFDVGENCDIDNLELRPIVWGEDIYKEQVLVGDTLAISENQAKEHKLKLIFEIKDMIQKDVILRGYRTDPQEKCFPEIVKNFRCDKGL